MKKVILALLLVSAPAFAFDSIGRTLNLTVFGPTVSTSELSKNKEVIVAAQEDAADYLSGGAKSANLKVALEALRSAGAAGSDEALAAKILEAIQD